MLSRLFFMLCVLMVASPLRAQPTPPRATLVRDLRLDATNEDFPTVSRVFVGPRGQIVVPLPQDMQVRVYDSTGKSHAKVGRRGAGPGEFQHLGAMGWTADTLWVHDTRQRRITFIAPDAKVLRAAPYTYSNQTTRGSLNEAPAGTFSRFVPMAVGAGGAVIGEAYVSSRTPGNPAGEGERVLVRMPPAGAYQILAKLPAYEDPRWMMEIAGFGNSIPFLLSPRSAMSANGDRFALLTATVTGREGGTFTVQAWRTTGETVFTKTFPFRGELIPQRAKDSAAAEFVPKPGEPTEGPPDLGLRFQAMAKQKMPPVYVAVESLLLGLDNTVWVGLRPTADGRPYLVLNGRGDPIATVVAPKGSRIVQASAARVWMAETDNDGLTSIVRYRTAGIACGAVPCR
jgi:hypothetical protein